MYNYLSSKQPTKNSSTNKSNTLSQQIFSLTSTDSCSPPPIGGSFHKSHLIETKI